MLNDAARHVATEVRQTAVRIHFRAQRVRSGIYDECLSGFIGSTGSGGSVCEAFRWLGQ